MQLRRDFLRSLEAATVGFFLVQSVRFLFATLYAHVSSADSVRRVDARTVAGLPGVVDPAEVRGELLMLLVVLLAPLLGLVIARTRWSIPLTVALVAVGRTLTLTLPQSNTLTAAVVAGAGTLYLTLLIIRRARFVPGMMATGFAVDQVLRSLNGTADPTFDPAYRVILLGSFETTIENFMIVLALCLLLLTLIATWVEREESRLPGFKAEPHGVLSGWGALALGSVLFLEFTLLGLPNAAARWAEMDYYLMLPILLTATLLPVVPEVRIQAGQFLSTFDVNYRGWLWTLLLVLLLITGKRMSGLPAGLALATAQFLTILTFWWLVKQPEVQPRVNPTPILVLVSIIIFALLAAGHYFTFNYAFVRTAAGPFSILSSLATGMRNMGLPLTLFAAAMSCLPMILERQIIPWRPGRVIETIVTLGMILVVTISTARAVAPNRVLPPSNPNCLRIASLNIHGGYTSFFAPNLEQVADLILTSGADVVLLQEVEAGILTSGSIDQALWLSNRLNMHQTFFGQNEDLEGLAVLSRMGVSQSAGTLLTSTGAQAGVQYVSYSLDESGNLDVYNVWLGYPLADANGQPLPEQSQDHTRQLDEVQGLISANHFMTQAANPDRIVLGGSFNFDESSPLYNRLDTTVFVDPFQGLFEEDRATLYLVNGESARWDYIWLYNLANSGNNIIQEHVVSNRRMSIVEVGREANTRCPAS